MLKGYKMGNSFLKVIILILFCLNAHAAENQYNIELIIFSQEQPTTELFEEVESKIAWPRKVAKRSEYADVKSEKLSLQASYSKLARGKGYHPIMYEAWTQKVNSNSYSRAIRIRNQEGTIDGFFMLQRGHLVHMIADIEYSPNEYEEDSPIYRLNEKRRFKLNDTHYFDHPKFGILARVSPVKKEEELAN